MLQVDYSYYTDTFLGDVLPESEFQKFIKRAEPYVSLRTFGRADDVVTTDICAGKLKDCLCSVAEIIKGYTANDGTERGAVVSESVGGSWSRSYGSSSDDLGKTLDGIVSSKIYVMLANTGLLFGGVD